MYILNESFIMGFYFLTLLVASSVYTLNGQELDEGRHQNRMNNLIIYGIQHRKNEDVLRIVEKIGRKLGLQNPMEDVLKAFRQICNRATKPIVLYMYSERAKDKWIRAYRRKQLWGDSMFICEQVKKSTVNLLAAAKEWGKKNNFDRVWLWHSQVFYRRMPNTTERSRVNNMHHLKQLEAASFNNYTSTTKTGLSDQEHEKLKSFMSDDMFF
uniref:Uncharacterized protein n=1 Tax=Cacopsylla melanoneura TaxID=428564 RepID=A0A8D8TCR6_9HEMI